MMMPRKPRPRRERSEVSCCIKYLVFGFNVIFWLIGGALCAIGLWAWTEKDMFRNIGKLTNIALDPALLFIIVGGVMFVIGFTVCVGALRENTVLLLIFSIFVGVIFFLELIGGILGFVYKDWVKSQIEDQVRKMIISYRKDEDLQNLIDWVQKGWLQCCGVETYKDWELNMYFNCSSPGREACGVPFSCCKPTEAVIENKQCGYDMMKTEHEIDKDRIIWTLGCVPAGEQWLEANLIPVAGVLVGIALLQILGICFAQNLRSDIQAQRTSWYYTFAC